MIDPVRHQSQVRALHTAPDKRALRSRPVKSPCHGCGRPTRSVTGVCPGCRNNDVSDLSIEELQTIIAAARAELARRATRITEALEAP